MAQTVLRGLSAAVHPIDLHPLTRNGRSSPDFLSEIGHIVPLWEMAELMTTSPRIPELCAGDVLTRDEFHSQIGRAHV